MSPSDLRPVLDALLLAARAFLLFAFLGGVASLPLLFILRRKRWLVRRPWGWNLLTTLVYPYVLAVCILGGGALGVVRSAKHQTHAWVEQTLGPMALAKLPAIKDWLSNEVEWGNSPDLTLDEAARRVLARLYYPPKTPRFRDRQKAAVINYLTLNFGKWVVTAGLGTIVAFAAGRAGDSLGLDDETVHFSIDVIRKMDLSKVDQNLVQVFERALLDKLDGAFRVLLLKVGLIALAALLLPGLEILLYFFWYQRRAGPRTASPV